MKKKYLTIAVLLIAFGFYSCTKEEGYGGLGKISGKVYAYDITSSGNIRAQGYIGEVKVYISQHNNPNYFDNVNSSYDGSFQFKYLNKGSYDLWVFSDCDTCVWKQKYEVKAVDISTKKQSVTIEDFKIIF